MKLTKSLVALAMGLGIAAGANATTYDLGTIVAPSVYTQSVVVGVGSFSDKWIFDITTPMVSGGSVSNLNIFIQGMGSLYNIDGLSVKLFDNTNTLLVDLDSFASSTANFKTGSGPFAPANDYYFTVSGNGNGISGGNYVFAVSTLPVPEPETYAMLLAGLGLIGAVARRRNVK